MKSSKLNIGEIVFWIIIALLLGLSLYALFR